MQSEVEVIEIVTRTGAPPPSCAALQGEVPVSEMPDTALVQRLCADDPTALDALYRRHKGVVYRFSLLWTGSAALAADVTQDVFVHVLTRAADYAPARGAVLPWLLGVTRNFCRQRSGTTRDIIDIDDEALIEHPALQTTGDALEVLAGREDIERLRRAIAALPPYYRDVLVLTELAERSYVETALICGCELNTVRSRLSRARALLVKWMKAT